MFGDLNKISLSRRYVVNDVSGDPIGPILRGQAVQVQCREHLGSSYLGNSNKFLE